MPQLHPSWQLSFVTAAVLASVHVAGRLRARGGVPAHRAEAAVTAFAREFALVASLLGIWQLIGGLVHTRIAGATERGYRIAHLQDALGLPAEQHLQRLAGAWPPLLHAADVFYAYAHLNGTAVFVVWLWWRHRDVYPRMRAVLVGSTLACLLVQLVPVAPPRMLADLGFVDTALQDGTSVYGPFGSGIANQLSAMPSVHVAWAFLVAWYVGWNAPPRWRWIGPAHLGVTVLVVVVTANHWWADGAVAVGLAAVAMVVVDAVRRLAARPAPGGVSGAVRPPLADPGPVPRRAADPALPGS